MTEVMKPTMYPATGMTAQTQDRQRKPAIHESQDRVNHLAERLEV